MLKRSAVIALLCLSSAGLAAQQQAKGSWTPPKTAWGDPDLSGTWPSTDMVGVPFERPAELGTRTELTAEEFAARQKQAAQRSEADAETVVSAAARTGDGTGPPSHWLEWGKASKQASLIVEPADGRLPPMTPEGQRRTATVKNTYVVFTGFNDPTELGPYDRCISRGVLGLTFPVIYNNGNQILQFPGYVAIRYEMIHETRIIPLDGRAHLPTVAPLVHGRRARPLGRQHAGRRDDELQRQDRGPGQREHAHDERRAEARRAIHADGAGQHSVRSDG